ncbi:hypothetical protein [Marisediminicola sp. LYQ85]|uniref:hypothetical protein n=1 Tax=Marisediminicola sp. LYQ85 TaxID=3391062 RepID=UPI0039833B7B
MSPPVDGAELVARLAESPLEQSDTAAFLTGADGAQGYSELHGLVVISAVSSLFSPGGDDACLFVARAQDVDDATDTSYSGPVSYGCGAGPFPASVEMRVTDDMPEEFVAQFAPGAALQFVLDETTSSVVVFAAVD